jgi:hypothetical protein
MPSEIQETLATSIGWIALVSALLLAGIAALLHQLLGRVRAMEERLAALDRLDGIQGELSRLQRQGQAGDQARLEGALVELRDSQRRLAERLVQAAETATRERSGAPGGESAASGSERVVNRLLAQGYEGVHLLATREEVERAFEAGGELLVEARREGVVCKGRVRIADGRIRDAELRSAHSMFP